jgi:hypothetical protein
MIEQILEIPAAGTTEALLVRPDSKEPVPAFIQLTDIFGLRPAFAEQATGIAERGYVVLTPNMFYRTSKVPVFSFGPDFRNEQTRDRSRELSNPLATGAMERDGSAYVDFLASQSFVARGPIGAIIATVADSACRPADRGADADRRDPRHVDQLPIAGIEGGIGAQPPIVMVDFVFGYRTPQATGDEPLFRIYVVRSWQFALCLAEDRRLSDVSTWVNGSSITDAPASIRDGSPSNRCGNRARRCLSP